MESFIVRIYRKTNTQQELFGTVERASDSQKLTFKNPDELWGILSPPKGKNIFPDNREIGPKKRRRGDKQGGT